MTAWVMLPPSGEWILVKKGRKPCPGITPPAQLSLSFVLVSEGDGSVPIILGLFFIPQMEQGWTWSRLVAPLVSFVAGFTPHPFCFFFGCTCHCFVPANWLQLKKEVGVTLNEAHNPFFCVKAPEKHLRVKGVLGLQLFTYTCDPSH